MAVCSSPISSCDIRKEIACAGGEIRTINPNHRLLTATVPGEERAMEVGRTVSGGLIWATEDALCPLVNLWTIEVRLCLFIYKRGL